MTNILLTFKLGEKAVDKKNNPKIKTLKSDLESEVYEYIDNTLKSPLIIDRDDLFTFNHFLINEKWYFENIDSVLPILENEPKFLKNDFSLIIAIKYSYINSIWFKGRSIKSNLIKFKAFIPLCTIFKFYHINGDKSLSRKLSPHVSKSNTKL